MKPHRPKITASTSGATAEQYAADWLTGQGVKILSRNYRTQQGEIDLVAKEGGTLVFVEVRFRRSPHFGLPAETIDRRKQHRLSRAALHYLQQHRIKQPCRFDALCLTQGNGTAPFQVAWCRDAFRLGEP